MKKILKYKDYSFKINVTLFFQVEKRIDGKRLHKVEVESLDGYEIYFTPMMCESDDLKITIELIETKVKEWVDDIEGDSEKSPEQIILEEMGFKSTSI